MRRLRVLVFVASAAALLGAGCARATPAATTTAMPSTSPVASSAAVGGSAFPALGSWGGAIAVPGLAALDKGKHGRPMSVSCSSAGNCAAGGFYTSDGSQGCVISERQGRWGLSIAVPGLEALNIGAGSVEGAYVDSVSCGSAGDCAAAGTTWTSSGTFRGSWSARRLAAGAGRPAGTTALDRWPVGWLSRHSWLASRPATGGGQSRYRGQRR
jgi:hypothetical protein